MSYMQSEGNNDNKENGEGGTENGGKFTKRKGCFCIVENSGQSGPAKFLTSAYFTTAGR
jgi:hypothetical protein